MGGARMFGKYELVEELGRGGMAEVWKAKIRGIAGFERTLVIKRILPQLVREEEFVAMFVREAQLCSMLSHANIVQVYELGELEGEYYLAMEYVNGRDLHALIRRRPKEPPPPGLAAIVGRDVGRALSYAYQLRDERQQPLRLIHRDVTPSNVMLTFDGATKLVDFGVAKATAVSSMTAVGAIKGKLSYMAPEQVKGGEVDHRSDLFALGIVMHETLTGRRLFKGDDDQDTVERVLSEPIYPPSQINSSVPVALDAIVMRALARDPQRRYQSGDALADELEALIHRLKWGPTQLAALVRERFPEGEGFAPATTRPTARPTVRSGSNPFADATEYEGDRFAAVADPTGSTSDGTGRSLRPTLPLVRTIDQQGAWTSHTELPTLDPPTSPEMLAPERVLAPALVAPSISPPTLGDTGDFMPVSEPTAEIANPWSLRIALIGSVALFVTAGITYFLHTSQPADAIVVEPTPARAPPSPSPAATVAMPVEAPVVASPTVAPPPFPEAPVPRSRPHVHRPKPSKPEPDPPKKKSGESDHDDIINPF